MTAPPSFVVSLDFELYWGMHDKCSLESYRANLEGVRAAIDGTLKLFERHAVAATWATVGLLMCDGRDDAVANAPRERPRYSSRLRDPYPLLDRCGPDEASDPLHFAPSVVSQIAACPRQEIGTHTFSHYYALEPGQTPEQFEADLEAAGAVTRRAGHTLSSIVFPKNQVCEDYLAICQRRGLTAYRPNRSTWMQRPDPAHSDRRLRRAARLLDACVPLESDVVRPYVDASGLVAIPGSRQLRPVGARSSGLEVLMLRRILAGMREAAVSGGTYHLWWHPHNFGANVARNLEVLDQVLTHHRALRARYGVRSETMRDVATRVLAPRSR